MWNHTYAEDECGVFISPVKAIILCFKLSHLRLAISRQLSYKKLSVESTCRKYLDMLARNIRKYYTFVYKYSSSTIGDVLHAKDGPERKTWNFVRAFETYETIDSEGYTTFLKKGDRLTTVPLPQLYSADEWSKISKFNFATSERVHSGEST